MGAITKKEFLSYTGNGNYKSYAKFTNSRRLGAVLRDISESDIRAMLELSSKGNSPVTVLLDKGYTRKEDTAVVGAVTSYVMRMYGFARDADKSIKLDKKVYGREISLAIYKPAVYN